MRTSSRTILRVTLLTGATLLIVCLPVHAQRTIHIPADFPAIQPAIDASSSGDILLVSPGTYSENLDLRGKAITLRSTEGPAVTILDGRRLAPTVTFATGESRSTTLSGFTIRNGAPVPGSPTHGGGIVLRSASPTLLNNTFSGNLCAAIDGTESAPLIQSSTITLTHSDPTCLAQAIAPIVLTGDPASGSGLQPTLLNNTIEHNDLTGNGLQPNAGAIALLAVRATLQGNTIRFNTTPGNAPGAIQVLAQPSPAGTAPILIGQNLIYANNTACGAGGLTVSILNDPTAAPPAHTEIQILNNTIADNQTSAACSPSTAEVTLSPGSLPGQVLLANNILAASSSHPAISCPTPLTAAVFHHNLLSNTAGLILGPTCPDPGANRLADPMFLDRDPIHADYHVPIRSPAVDSGWNASPMPPQDLDDTPRRQNATDLPTAVIDLGPYEYPAPHVVLPTTTTLIATPSPSEAFQPIALTAQVTAPGTTIATGSITFANQTHTLATIPIDVNGRAVFTISTLPAGPWTLTASYTGSEAFGTSAATQGQTVKLATTILSFAITPSTATQAQTVTLSANAEAPLSTRIPTGNIQFYEITPTTASLIATSSLDPSGATAMSLPPMSAGTHRILAAYPGTPDFAAVTLPPSDALTLTIAERDYTVTLAAPTLTVETQHHAPMNLTITSLGSFSGPVTLACANLPPTATCTFNPSTANLTAGGSVQVALMLDTDAVPGFYSGFFPWGILSFLTLRFLPRRRYRRLPRLFLALPLLILPLSGCSAGLYPKHTPPGTYQVQITTQSPSTAPQVTPLTLNVTP